MERCAIELAAALGPQVPVVAIGEDAAPPDVLAPRFTSLGGSLRGVARVFSVVRLRRWSAAVDGVVVVVGVWAALPLLVCRRRLPFAVVVWEHSMSPENLAANPSLRLLHRAARHLYGRADAVVAVSEVLAAELEQWLAAPPVIAIPNLLRDEDAAAGPPRREGQPEEPAGRRTSRKDDGRVVVLAVGRLVPVKNHELLLTALTRLPEDWVLDVAGDGPLREALSVRCERLGLGSRVRFLGHVPDMKPLYDSCDVVALPSHGETFGLAMLEAARHERDVVVTDFPMARALVPSLVPGRSSPADADSFASTLVEVVTSPTPPHERRAAAARREHFVDPKRVVDRWVHLLQSVAPDLDRHESKT
ncbi:glycosyltransferase family 4 protein [Pseudokineococcus basanitobsidens]|uniref:Glycosyltransferase family 4 protein n=1 Tax=Pseudokineococcus basanitobsidens TaxID=1926649 RepID=A0ABU8RI02_9ACTN